MLVPEEDLIEFCFLKRLDHPVRVPEEVDIKRILKIVFCSLKHGSVERVGRSVVDKWPVSEPLLQLPVKLLRGPTAALELFHLGFGLNRVVAFDFHQGAKRAFEPVTLGAGERGLSFTQSVE